MGFFKPNIEKMEAKGDVKGLIMAMWDRDRDIQWQAARALGNVGDARAVEHLIQALKNRRIRNDAALSLGQIGDTRAVEPLIEALKDEYELFRSNAARALGLIGDARAVEPLANILSDEDKYVREDAEKALENIKLGGVKRDDPNIKKMEAKGDVKGLIKALKYEDKNARRQAVYALVGIEDARLVEPLCQFLQDEDWDVGGTAAKILGNIGDARAVEPLIQALKDEDVHVKSEAAKALGKIEDARAVEPLVQLLKDDESGDFQQKEAAKALGKIGDARAVEPLIQALNYVPSEAALALGKIGDARAVEPLVQLLFKWQPNLGQLSDASPVDNPLQKALLEIAPNSIVPIQIIQDAIDASGYEHLYYGHENDPGRLSLEKSNAAVNRLCEIKSPMTSNLLWLISKKRNFSVNMSSCGVYGVMEEVDFSKQRQMATEELARRGSPPYDPSAFLKKSDPKG